MLLSGNNSPNNNLNRYLFKILARSPYFWKEMTRTVTNQLKSATLKSITNPTSKNRHTYERDQLLLGGRQTFSLVKDFFVKNGKIETWWIIIKKIEQTWLQQALAQSIIWMENNWDFFQFKTTFNWVYGCFTSSVTVRLPQTLSHYCNSIQTINSCLPSALTR